MGKEIFHFTFKEIEGSYKKAKDIGYHFYTLNDYFNQKSKNINGNIIVNRVDIDLSCKKAKILANIFNSLNIKATFFVRLHAPEYNPFSFENYKCLKFIKESGHEIGLHSEVIDESIIWKENARQCLKKDINILNNMLDIKIKGIASHGGMTGLNNLDFWKENMAIDFDLKYEAYSNVDGFNLFNSSFYISDSCWTYWKCYDKGALCSHDRRTFSEHLDSKHKLIYLLIHPETYYFEHFYE